MVTKSLVCCARNHLIRKLQESTGFCSGFLIHYPVRNSTCNLLKTVQTHSYTKSKLGPNFQMSDTTFLDANMCTCDRNKWISQQTVPVCSFSIMECTNQAVLAESNTNGALYLSYFLVLKFVIIFKTRQAIYYKVTWKRVRVIVFVVKKSVGSIYYECASVFLPYVSGMQSACFVLCCHLWPVCLCRIFTHYLIKGTIYGEKRKRKCMF